MVSCIGWWLLQPFTKSWNGGFWIEQKVNKWSQPKSKPQPILRARNYPQPMLLTLLLRDGITSSSLLADAMHFEANPQRSHVHPLQWVVIQRDFGKTWSHFSHILPHQSDPAKCEGDRPHLNLQTFHNHHGFLHWLMAASVIYKVVEWRFLK